MFNLFSKNAEKLKIPGCGKIVEIESVPDLAFAEKIIGDGVGFIPEEGRILSPCNGTVAHIFPTGHAVAIETEQGSEILLHLGIDTVELKGKGFDPVVEEGQIVKRGQLLVKMDLDFIKEQGKPIICPIIITNMENVKRIKPYFCDSGCADDLMLEIVKV